MKFSLIALIFLVTDSPVPSSASANPSPAASLIFPWSKPAVLEKEKTDIRPAPPSSSLVALPPNAATVIIVSQSSQSQAVSHDKAESFESQKEKKLEKKSDKKKEKKPDKKYEEKIASCGDDNVYIGKSTLQWSNSKYPSGESERMSCVLRIKRDPKCWQEIPQIKVIIADLHLAQPDDGACKHDNITVHGSLLQGQEVGRGLQLCGEEPDDFLLTSGRKYPQRKHLYLHFANHKDAVLSLRVNLSPSKTGRRWNILLKPIEVDSPERAPFGCLEYYFKSADKTQEYFRVVRSLNYPMSYEHGMIDHMQVGICFGATGCELPVTSLRLTPDAGDFRCDAFRLGKPDKSGTGSDCKRSYFLLPYSAGTPSRICGAKEKDKSGPIILKHGPFPRLEYHSSAETGGYRFLWDFDLFKCPETKCSKL